METSTTRPSSGPLAGVRIIDMTSVLMGPYATQILGDLGADIIKIEPPGGDTVRGIGPARHAGMGSIFLHANRSKRSVVLDLKKSAGRSALLRLAATADVLIYNVRPQAMARLGLDHAAVAAAVRGSCMSASTGTARTGPTPPSPHTTTSSRARRHCRRSACVRVRRSRGTSPMRWWTASSA